MPDEPAPDTLSAAVRRGAPWVVAGQVASQVVSLVNLAVLYRHVAPEEFGLFGMALPFVMLPRTLATLGLSAAAVQRRELANDERSLVFWMQTAVGIVVTLATFALAWPAASMYGVREVAPLIQALAATVLIASLSATHQALLERRMQLARVTAVRLAGQVLGTIAAVLAAWNGWGAQALVVQQYGELLALLAASWLAHPWLPGWPARKLSVWWELASFGGYYSLSSLLFVLTQNIDKVLLGLWLGDTQAGQAIVGAYSQAYNLMMRPVYLVTAPLGTVLLPALSRSQNNQFVFSALVHRAFHAAAFLLCPASIGLMLVAREMMPILGGPEWTDAGLLLAAFAPAIALQAWINLCGSVLAARGRMRMLCFGALVLLVVSLQAICLGYFIGAQLREQPLGAALGVACALTLAILVALGLPYVAISLAASGVAPRPVLWSAIPPLRNALLMGFAVYFAGHILPGQFPSIARVLGQIVIGVAVYAALSWPEVSRLRDARK